MAVRILKVSSLASALLASSGLYLYSRPLDINDLSVIRFGRAAATTAVISYDYLTAFRHVEHGTEEYQAVKSKLSEIFVSFEEEPQGAASLAQVHRAVLHDGRTVAVKVQHPKVQKQSSKDIMVMEVLVKAVHWLFPDFAFMWLVEEAKKNMPLELDFLNEGHNAERVASLLSHFPFLKVPTIHWDLSTKRILTMEFVEGGQVDDRDYMKKHNINVNKISENLGQLYSEMIFVHGFVHCDPHPGNVLVRRQKQQTEIVLLDHGLYQVLLSDVTIHFSCCRLRVRETSVSLPSRLVGQLDHDILFPYWFVSWRRWDQLQFGISSSLGSAPDVEIRTNAARYLPQISDLLNRVPRQMLLLLKTNDLLRGIETTLQTRASSSSFINMSRCCVRAVARHKRSKARSRSRRVQIMLTESLSLWKLSVYELLLWFRGSMMIRWLAAILAFLH
ncbi:aarF domain containing kinase 1 [Nothobranchius furzeri]|uniref:AarF domain-containing protein kinase 1 n=1 Tax=Nothobranchius furzeri TaxID=105023 RepID=A0A9D2XEY1_NOTFU|nr:aarF domain containing kinase 1 [Nothobranchius furzeri]